MTRPKHPQPNPPPENEVTRLQGKISKLQRIAEDRQVVENTLNAAMENLTIHQEELRTQNDELRRTQDELEESRRQYVDLFEAAPIGYFILDKQGTVQQVNKKGAELLGYSQGYITGKPLLTYLSHPTRMAFSAHLRGISPECPSASAEAECVQSSGKIMYIRVESVLINERHKSGQHFRTAFIDITGRKQAEEALLRTERQLRQTHKMEAIGTLAGGIAHDFNNILMAMIGYTEIAQTKLPTESPLRRTLNEVLIAGCRARDLIKQILMFSRQTEPEKQVFVMGKVVQEIVKLLKATIPSTIQVSVELNAPSTCVFGDPTELHQVLINLCTNAEYAMRERGGILTITLKEVEVIREWASQNPPLRPGPHLHLTVKDTGPGVPPGVQERMFDPFFTTKALGEGTGMGLAMAQGIVAHHQGLLHLEHTGPEGTSFGIYLPVMIDSPLLQPTNTWSTPRKRGKILFVDDESHLARMGMELLEHLGYEATACTGGAEALSLVKKHPDYFDVLVTDQTMPLLTGEALASKVLALNPHLPIILITGFSHSMNEEKAKSLGIFSFLMKPLVANELDHAIQAALSKDEEKENKREAGGS